MTTRLLIVRFRRTMTVALVALAVVMALAGLTGLSSLDMASFFESQDGALTVAQK